MLKIARGESSPITDDMAIHFVAAAYGSSPAAVREWPNDDFVMARAMLDAHRVGR